MAIVHGIFVARRTTWAKCEQKLPWWTPAPGLRPKVSWSSTRKPAKNWGYGRRKPPKPLWEHEQKEGEDFLLEKKITIDNDEIEIGIDTGDLIKKLREHRDISNYALQAKVDCETIAIKQCESPILQIKAGAIYD
jgi:hypothetical protein